MKTAVVYARYSSEKQTEQSIEGQLRVCHEFAQRNDILIVDVYVDRAMTGKNDNRKDFQRMLKDSFKKAWDCVLVYKLDRFSRNKYETAIHKKTLRDNGIRLLSATENIPDTPEGIILESLLEGMAEYYSAELAQKVSRGMNENRQKGLFTGGRVPYGYKVIDKKVYIHEDHAKIVREIYEKYAAGVYVKDIIASLEARGISNRDRPFAMNTIYKILKNEKYLGILRHGDEVFTNIYPQIIPNDIYEIVRQKVDENHYGKHNEVIYLLKNKLKCGYCGKSIISDSGTSKSGRIMRYYRCRGRKLDYINCNKSIIRKEVLEKLVIDTTFKIFDNDENLSRIADKILTIHKQRENDESLLNILKSQKQEVKSAINNLISCLEKGIVTESTKTRICELEAQLASIENKISIKESKEKSKISKGEIIKYLRTSLKKEPQQIIRLLVKEVVLYDNKIEIYYNYIDNKKRSDDEHQVFSFYKDTFQYLIDEHKINGKPYILTLKIEAFI